MDCIIKHSDLDLLNGKSEKGDSLLKLDLIISVAIKSVQRNFMNIAQALYRISTEYLFDVYAVVTPKGDKRKALSVYEYAAMRFGMSRRTVDTFLHIWEAFSLSGDILPEYSMYSYSQLEELVPLAKDGKVYDVGNLPAWVKSEVSPTSTVREIRYLKKAHKEKPVKKVESPTLAEKEIIPAVDDMNVAEDAYGTFEKPANDKERECLVKNYVKTFMLFAKNEFLNLEFYRMALSNGEYFVISRNATYEGLSWFGIYIFHRKDGSFSSFSYFKGLIDYLRRHLLSVPMESLKTAREILQEENKSKTVQRVWTVDEKPHSDSKDVIATSPG